MDLVKERVAGTKRALQEADNWTSLDTQVTLRSDSLDILLQVEDAFECDDLELVSSLLTGMQASLRLLSHVADYSERVAHLEQHRNRLEASLSPQLVTALAALDTAAALRLVAVFRAMERGGQLTKYYHKCVRAGLLQRWAVIVAEGEGEGARQWTKQLYTELAARLREHRAWVTQVFPEDNPGDLMAGLLAAVLGSLEPSLEFCLEAAAKLGPSELELLAEVKAGTDAFAVCLPAVLEGAGEAGQREAAMAVYRPFRGPLARYGELEARALAAEVAAWSTGGKDTIEEIHSLASCVARLGTAVEAAAGRCQALTAGCGFPGLAAAVGQGLGPHLDRYRRIMRRLEKKKVVVDDDWSVLQHCLSANQATGDLLLQVEQLDMTLSLAFLESTRPFLGPEAAECPQLQQHHALLCATPEQRAELERLRAAVAARTGSATPMLQQAIDLIAAACADLQKATFAIMFHPVSSQLELVPGLAVWAGAGQTSVASADLPDFSFSPGEYITCVGEYLMTLPQHLEPYMESTCSSAALGRAFRQAVFPGSSSLPPAGPQSPADFLLGCISASTCSSYLSYIGSIPAPLGPGPARQLAMDIAYLGEVLDDLGHPLLPELAGAAALLRAAPGRLQEEAAGRPARALALVTRLRGLQQAD
jgi:hypothetical protein